MKRIVFKNILTSIMPYRVVEFVCRHFGGVRRQFYNAYSSDCRRLYSVLLEGKANSRMELEAKIIARYHVIEKGLTMPSRRLGFGVEMVSSLIDLVGIYKSKYGVEVGVLTQITHAIGVIREYYNVHVEEGFDFSEMKEFWEKVRRFDSEYAEVAVSTQRCVLKEDFYKDVDSTFYNFANARHCVRNWEEDRDVCVEDVRRAVELAMTTPSACNRQHSRVRCIVNKDFVRQVLEVQGGTRGFGHLANKLIIVSADMSVLFGVNERHDPYINGGMFIMNLSYALYHYKIGYCILTWGVAPEKDAWLRDKIALPENEVIIGLIACGKCSDKFFVASSPRKNVEEVFTVI